MDIDEKLAKLGWWWLVVAAFALLPLGVIDIWNRGAWWLNRMWDSWWVLGFFGVCIVWVLWFIAWLTLGRIGEDWT